jgi:hypothetical protein
MQKRVLVGLLQQRELQRTARKLWRYDMIALNRKVAVWKSDPAFEQVCVPHQGQDASMPTRVSREHSHSA